MVYKPLKPCHKPGCRNLTKHKYCETHQELQSIESSQRNKYYNHFKRDKQSNDFYHSKEWVRLSQTFYIKHKGLCVQCLKENKITLGTKNRKGKFVRNIVDHIVPITVDWDRRLDESNLQILCKRHHNEKTAEDKRLYG